MSTYARNSQLAAYQSVSAHGGVANGDPYSLVLMLMDAAAERMATARGCIERGETARQARLLHSCVNIVGELRGSLNMVEGGATARHLGDLYEFMIRKLLLANASKDPACLVEISRLLDEVRGAWVAIGPEVRNAARGATPAAWNNSAAPASSNLTASSAGSGGSRG